MVVMIDDCMQKVAFARYPAFGGSRSESFSRRRTREAYFRTTGDRTQDSGLGRPSWWASSTRLTVLVE